MKATVIEGHNTCRDADCNHDKMWVVSVDSTATLTVDQVIERQAREVEDVFERVGGHHLVREYFVNGKRVER